MPGHQPLASLTAHYPSIQPHNTPDVTFIPFDTIIVDIGSFYRYDYTEITKNTHLCCLYLGRGYSEYMIAIWDWLTQWLIYRSYRLDNLVTSCM